MSVQRTPRDVTLADGRSLRVYDSTSGETADLTIVWHHGSPQTGASLEPHLAAAAARGIRLISYARPSYGGSSPHAGRTVADAAADVAEALDALGVDRFATMGASGGGPHALACAALLPGRVTAVACLAGLAPFDGSDAWFAGMAGGGPSLRAAAAGRAERDLFEETAEFDEDSFIRRDYEALASRWASLNADAGAASSAGPAGLIDDDLAFVAAWGFELSAIGAPALVVQGGRDRVVPAAHADRLMAALPDAELWLRPLDGHISVLDASALAIDWLVAHSTTGR